MDSHKEVVSEKNNEVVNIYIVNAFSETSEKLIQTYPLSAASQARLAQRHTALAQRHFLISRALVQSIASEEMACAKPVVLLEGVTGPTISAAPLYHISLSHSHHFVAVCINKQKIAIDIEHAIKPRPYVAIARFAFHAEEYQWLIANSENDSQLKDNFYRLWTARECFYKLGLMQTLADQSFSIFTEESRSRYHSSAYSEENLYLSCVQLINIENAQHRAVKFIVKKITA